MRAKTIVTAFAFAAGCGGAPSTSTAPNDIVSPTSAPSAPSTSDGSSNAARGDGGTQCAVELASGDAHVCARRGDGALFCWGLNSHGQLGVGDAVDRATPTDTTLTGVSAVAAGSSHTCAIAGGRAWCWGANDQGQLGDGTFSDRASPVAVGELSGAVALTAGAEHTCALDGAGRVFCWGDDEQGQLGDGRSGLGTRSATPVELTLPAAVELSARGDHTCARLADGRVACWGSDVSGELGDGKTGGLSSTPSFVAGLTDALTVGAGGAHSCAVDSSGALACWGNNGSGQLGVGYVSYDAPGALPSPQPVSLAHVAVLAAGQAHTCALDGSGVLSCWGANGRGQLGNGSFTPAPSRGVASPSAIATLLSARALSAGSTHSCAIDASGAVYCWGGNAAGELGTGAPGEDTATPVRAALPCP